MNNQLTDLQNKLKEKRDAWVTADEKTRASLMSDAKVLKAQIRALEVAKEAPRRAPKALIVNTCIHPLPRRHFYKDGSEACDECNVLFPNL